MSNQITGEYKIELIHKDTGEVTVAGQGHNMLNWPVAFSGYNNQMDGFTRSGAESSGATDKGRPFAIASPLSAFPASSAPMLTKATNLNTAANRLFTNFAAIDVNADTTPASKSILTKAINNKIAYATDATDSTSDLTRGKIERDKTFNLANRTIISMYWTPEQGNGTFQKLYWYSYSIPSSNESNAYDQVLAPLTKDIYDPNSMPNNHSYWYIADMRDDGYIKVIGNYYNSIASISTVTICTAEGNFNNPFWCAKQEEFAWSSLTVPKASSSQFNYLGSIDIGSGTTFGLEYNSINYFFVTGSGTMRTASISLSNPYSSSMTIWRFRKDADNIYLFYKTSTASRYALTTIPIQSILDWHANGSTIGGITHQQIDVSENFPYSRLFTTPDPDVLRIGYYNVPWSMVLAGAIDFSQCTTIFDNDLERGACFSQAYKPCFKIIRDGKKYYAGISSDTGLPVVNYWQPTSYSQSKGFCILSPGGYSNIGSSKLLDQPVTKTSDYAMRITYTCNYNNIPQLPDWNAWNAFINS
ncbi:hypothetical protein FACS1894208_01160 [Clostridia bacterium]|nr:hypothetical protein FACS1894208_01160 [Clostridia bacterium]